METIGVLAADDHRAVPKALRKLIASEPDMEIAGQAANGLEAAHQLRSLWPDVHLAMPELSGREAIRQIKEGTYWY